MYMYSSAWRLSEGGVQKNNLHLEEQNRRGKRKKKFY